MRPNAFLLIGLFGGNLLCAEPPSDLVAKVKSSYGAIPLSFEANRGQADSRVKFLARTSTHTVLLEPTASVLIGRKAIVRTAIVGGSPSARLVSSEPQSGASNYLIGRDANKWITDVPHYGRIEYSNVYPGVNLAYYGNGRQLEYDWVVAPGVDPKLIRTRYDGVQGLRIASNGDLILKTAEGELRHERPIVYQTIDGHRQAVDGRYALRGGNEVTFRIGKYDRTKALVIDPILAYSSYLGGSSWDAGYGVAVDGNGYAYVVGGTSSAGFPAVNQFQNFQSGNLCIGGDENPSVSEPCSDIFVTKINPSGTAIVYSTFIGGSADETAFSVALDANCSANCNAYVVGRTHSTSSFPITAGAYQLQNNGAQDSVVLKLNPAGNRLVFATFLGGENDDKASSIAVDGSGVYVTGQTLSTHFPTKNALYASNAGGWDGFISKLTLDGTTLLYSTYIGGPNKDEPRGIGVDSRQNAYITGRTEGNFPLKNPWQSTPPTSGKTSGFVTAINAAGNALIYSTYLGGDDFDYADAIAVVHDGTARDGIAYVGGITNSPTHWGGRAFPVTPGGGAYQTIRKSCTATSCPGSGDGFVSQLSPQGVLQYSTVFGGANTNDPSHYPESKAWGISFDQKGYIYASGYTNATDFPTVKGIQITNAGQHDVVILKFDPTCHELLFSTYFGGIQDDWGWGIATDQNGGIYVTGYTSQPDPTKPFPNTTPGHAVIQPTYGGGRYDAFIVKLANADLMLVPKSFQGNPITSSAISHASENSPKIAAVGPAAVYDPTVGLTTTNTILNQNSSISTEAADNPTLGGFPSGTMTSCTYGNGFSCLGPNNTVAFPPGTTIPSGTGLDVTTTVRLDNSPPIGSRLIFTLKTISDTNDPDPSNNSYTYNAVVGTPFTVNTSPQGLNVSIDNGPATPAPVQTALDGNVPHTICAISPQNGYVFQNWAGGPTSNCLTNVTLTPQAVYNANFAACSYSLPTSSATVGASAGSLTVNVTASPAGCAWTASPNASFLHVASYNGTASVTFSYDANPSSGTRSATPVIANAAFTLTQLGGGPVISSGVPRDFRGISRSDVLLYNPATGDEYTGLSNGSGGYSYTSGLFTPNFDTLRTGDFNGDGKADLAVYNSTNGLAYLGFGNGDGTFTFSSLFWSAGYNSVQTGDLNGDNKADVLLYNSAAGTAFTAISNGAGFTYKFVFISPGFTHLKLADFNGDGKADLLLYNRNTGTTYLGFGDGAGSFNFNQLFLSPGYDTVEVGDFNGDKKIDVLLYRSADGYLSTGLSTGTPAGFNFSSVYVSSGFTAARVADYNGDGLSDLILYNANSAAAYLGLGNGSGAFSFSGLFWSPGFDTVVSQDANGDGKSDIVLYNSATGTSYTGVSNGSGFTYTYSFWGPNRVLAQ